MQSDSRNVSLETLYNYLDYITCANLISKAERYDVRGKRILTGKYKYYLTDLGFTNILSEGKKEKIGAYLENIVYNELIARGYNAYKRIDDNYPKYVLSMDKFDLSQNGIIHKNIIDWLLKK